MGPPYYRSFHGTECTYMDCLKDISNVNFYGLLAFYASAIRINCHVTSAGYGFLNTLNSYIPDASHDCSSQHSEMHHIV